MTSKLRLVFSRRGRASYLSHLDLMHVFQRALTRAELPLRFTEGYNPHVVMSIALPLSVGVDSDCELLDFGVTGEIELEKLPEKLNPLLPEGISVLSAGEAVRPVSDIARVAVELDMDTVRKAEDLSTLFTTPVFVDKRSKSGVKSTDITPMIFEISFENSGDGAVLCRAVVAAQNPTLNPEYIAEAVRRFLDPDAAARVRRKALLDANGLLF